MKTIAELLSSFRNLDVKIWVDGDRLRYNAPKGALTPELREQLKEHKREILAFLNKINAAPSELKTIQPISRDNILPLSFAQERMWFLSQLETQSVAYNLPVVARLIGKLDPSVLERSFNEIIRRHEVLRTTFKVLEGQPIQVIAPILTMRISVTDLRTLSKNAREARIQHLALEEARRPFDLERGPLFRATLLHVDDREYILLATFHHIVYDGWSSSVFVPEFLTLYQAFSTGKPSPLPELPIQYADFAHWQRKWLQGDVLKQQLTYWKKQLSNSPQVLTLPTDRPRPARQTFQGDIHAFVIPKVLSDKLKIIARHEKSTLFVILLTVFKILLSRYTGQDDIIVGIPSANRHRYELEGLIGFFVNPLALRTDLSGNPTFRELLGRVHQVTLEAQAHQDIPFEMLVGKLHPERSLSYHPFFQVVFALQEIPTQLSQFPDITVEMMDIHNKTAKFDLFLDMMDTGQELTATLEYNSDLFDATTIVQITSHFKTLLKEIVANPDRRISELPLLTENERQQILVQWNDTQINYPQNTCLHKLFEAQAEQTPYALAVVFEDQHLIYTELNNKANQLAHYLQRVGVRPDVLVGICLERSLDMMVAILGILKAGGAYVPLDPAYPQERLSFMLEDVQVLLTQQELMDGFPNYQGHTLCLDTDWVPLIFAEPTTNVESNVAADNLAYVIYTSGSTGKPKGVMIRHRSVVNLLTGLQHAIYTDYQDSQLRVSLNGPLAFDTSVKQWIQLLQGHCLVIVPEAVRFDSEALLSFLNRQIDVFDCTPSQLRLLISAGLLDPKDGKPKCLLVGGEALDESTWSALAQAEHLICYNVYGPTECTVDATISPIRSSTPVLNEQERTRYARQILLENWGEETQKNLKAKTVFVAGAGGSGSPIITQLALLGVGCIKICDFDTVDLSNLNRQFIHCVSEEGRLGIHKAISAKKTVQNINPHVKVEIFQTNITAENVDDMVGDADLIFDSVDVFATKFILSQCAVRKGIPHIFYGMMDINAFGGIFYPPKSPCFHCLFDAAKVEQFQEFSQYYDKHAEKKLGTPVCCPPLFVSTGFMMMEALKILLGIGEPAYEKFFLFLQKGDTTIGGARGVQGIRYWMNQYFDHLLEKQGFSWEQGGWRNRFVEELQVSQNPECQLCRHMKGSSQHSQPEPLPEAATSDRPVIGRPIANTSVYILDNALNPVPIDVPGELHIGGAGLARGYLKQPDLTKERFIPDPFSNDVSARLYKTGDLVRYLPDGNIEFLGRTDDQVKIRGFRIEPGEIETLLQQHPDVRETVVIAREYPPDTKRLIAYVVPEPTRAPTIEGKERYILPNNLAIAHLHKNETDFLYKEIFEVQAYIKHGITVHDGDCIVDVGAHIGLFTLFLHLTSRDVKVYGIEPNPMVFECLRLNSSLYGVDATLFNCGVSNTSRMADFTAYPEFTILSGFYADEDEEKEVVRSFIRQQHQQEGREEQIPEQTLEELLSEKFKSTIIPIQVRTLSDIMEENNIERIDLLKINAEKSEYDILEGIKEKHWDKICQIAMEVHDIDGRLDQVKTLLKKHGYHFEIEQDWSLEQTTTTNYYIYAVQAGYRRAQNDTLQAGRQRSQPMLSDPILSPGELRSFLKQKLPDYMVPSAFVLLEKLPLTSNGKIDLRALPDPERGDLSGGYVAPRTSTEKILSEIWADVLRLDQIGTHDNFFELGGDSILSIQIITRARQAGLHFVPTQLFQHQTIAELATVAGTAISIKAEQGAVTGLVPLTPIQRWFFEQNFPEPHYWNQAILLETPQDLDPACLEKAIGHILKHHDALRLRFTLKDSHWQQECEGLSEMIPFSQVDLSQVPEIDQRKAIEETASSLQASLNISEGPLIRVALFNLGGKKRGRLLLVIHHLAVDGVSWRILLEDLLTAYQQISQGKTIQSLPKTTSFKEWSSRLTVYSQSEELSAELDYWLTKPWTTVTHLPVDYPTGKAKNVEASAAQISTSLSAEQTRALLQEVPQAYNTHINDVLLTALIQAFNWWTGQHSLLIDLEGHGREGLFEDVDISRTVGWFTSLFPVLLELKDINNPGEALKSIKEQLRHIPNRGIGYGLLRHLNQDETTYSKLQALPKAEVIFNYLGQLDQGLTMFPLFKIAKEPIGASHSPSGNRTHLLEINGFIAENRLSLNWTYSENIHQRATIESLAQRFMEALQTLIAHCQLPESGGYTPSDFPDVELNQDTLEQVLDEIEVDDF